MKLDYSTFPAVCVAVGLPRPVAEHKFHPTRKWRFDFAWPDHMLALEVDGGVWSNGRHTRGSGRVKDMEKQTEAAVLGWRLMYCQPKEIRTGEIVDTIRRAIRGSD